MARAGVLAYLLGHYQILRQAADDPDYEIDVTDGRLSVIEREEIEPQRARSNTEGRFAESGSQLSALNSQSSTEGDMNRLMSFLTYAVMFAEITAAPVPDENAIEWLRSRVAITAPELEALGQRLQAEAFSISGDMGRHLLAAIRDSIIDAIHQGTTLAEWTPQAEAVIAAAGHAPLKSHHVETVYRNWMSNAYHAGKWHATGNPAFAGHFDLLRYVAVMDDRTRFQHAAQHGTVQPRNSVYWTIWYPPNGHRCRCTVQIMSRRAAARRGVEVSGTYPAGNPDPGFSGNVGMQ